MTGKELEEKKKEFFQGLPSLYMDGEYGFAPIDEVVWDSVKTLIEEAYKKGGRDTLNVFAMVQRATSLGFKKTASELEDFLKQLEKEGLN